MPVIDNLVAYWALDETSGTRVDAHGSNDLSDTNTVGYTTGLVYSNAAQFVRANSEYLSITDNADLSLGGDIDVFFAVWAKISSKPAGVAFNFIAKGNGTDPCYRIGYDVDGDRFFFQMYYATGGGSNGAAVTANTFGAVSTGTWYLIMAWRAASNGRLYISINDGTADSTADEAVSTTFNEGANFYVGNGSFFGDEDLDGIVGPVAMWKGGLLDATQRTWLYNSGNGRTYAAIVSEAGIIKVQDDEGYGIVGSSTPTMATAFTGGNTLAMLVVRTSGSGTFTLSEPLYNGTISLVAETSDGNVMLFVKRNVTGGFTSVDLTCSDSSTVYLFQWYELENVHETNTITIETNSESSATSHNLASSGITGTGFFVGGAKFSAATTMTPGSGWTGHPGVSEIGSLQYKIEDGSGETGPYTTSTSVTATSLLALLPQAGTGGGGTPTVGVAHISTSAQLFPFARVAHQTASPMRQRLVRR